MTFEIKGTATDRRCTERCWNAKSSTCRCQCGGTNHGSQRRAAESDHTPDRFLPQTEGKGKVIGMPENRSVYLDNVLLDPAPSQKVYNHSPDGFSWGYGGSGVAQLALAILLHVTNDEQLSLKLYQTFKWEYLANLEMSKEFSLSLADVRAWVNKNK